MPLINLIQEQRLAIKRSEGKARAFFFGFAAVAVSSVGVYGFLIFESERAQGDAVRLKNLLRKNQPLVEQIDQNKKDVATLAPRLKTLQDAQLITDRWSRILQHISTQTPEKAWLTSMRAMATDPTKPISISFLGIAAAQAPIGEYMERLQNSADLEAVTLKYSQEKLSVGFKGIEFEIAADIAGSAEAKKVADEDKK